MKQKKYILPDSEIPTHYFNIQAIMPNKPLPFLHPATKQPLKAEDLFPIFAEELARQELDQGALAAAVGALQRYLLALADSQVDTACDDFAVAQYSDVF